MSALRGFRLLALALALSSGAAVAAPPLVDGDWLQARLADPGLVLVDMSEDDAQYRRFHLPGAARLSYGQLLKRRAPDNIPVRLSDAELFALLGQLGIQHDRHVVVYDDVGGLEAARLFWELERIGHPQVSVLDGGLVRWVLEGRWVENAPVTRAPTRYRAGDARRANEATLAEMRRAVETRDGVLLDVRTEQEYRGDGKSRSGHVPGARFWPWEQAVDMTRGFVRAAGEGIEASLKQTGAAAKDAPIIAYCRSGHRAAHSYWTLRSLGFENVKLYANSMNEYLADPGAPLKRGTEP